MRPAGMAIVYFIATADRSMVKIGISENPLNRLGSLMAWSPVNLDILATAPGRVQDERAIQGYFISQYSHREWFRANPEMLVDIAAVAATGTLPAKFVGAEDEPDHIRAKFNIRHTPEWRAKCSATQKARYQRDRLRKLAYTQRASA